MLVPAVTFPLLNLLGGHQLEYAQMDLCGIFYQHFFIVPSCASVRRTITSFPPLSNYIYLHWTHQSSVPRMRRCCLTGANYSGSNQRLAQK